MAQSRNPSCRLLLAAGSFILIPPTAAEAETKNTVPQVFAGAIDFHNADGVSQKPEFSVGIQQLAYQDHDLVVSNSAPTYTPSGLGIQMAQGLPAPADEQSELDLNLLPEQPEQGSVRSRDPMDQLGLALGNRRVYGDILTLQDRINTSIRPVLNAVTRYSTQSDDLEISQTQISQEFFFNGGASRIRPGLMYLSYMPEFGAGVTQYAVGTDGSHRINDWAAIAGDFWINSFDSGNLPNEIVPSYNVFLTLFPSDLFRVDINTKRELFDNILSIQKNISAYTTGGSVDYMPEDGIRLSVRGATSYFTDGNERQSAEAEGMLRLSTMPTIQIGLRAAGFQFTQQLNNGYFNPDHYISGEAMFRLQAALADDLDVELAASGGIEDSQPGGSKPLVKSSLLLAYRLQKNWTIDGGISYFSSQESSSSGFARTSLNLGLHYRFD